MAENPREIRRRIRAVDNTRQITRAMELVARTKLYRTQGQVQAARPYSESLLQLMRRLVSRGAADDVESPLLQSRPVERVMVIVFSADRGLCGSYNNNVLKRAESEVRELSDSAQVRLITVGRRGRDYFRWREFDVYDQFTGVGEEANHGLAQDIGRIAMRQYSAGSVDEVRLVYTRFESVFIHPVEVMKLLPLEDFHDEEHPEPTGQYIYEPGAETILQQLIPRYVHNSVYKVLTEAKASEHGARVTAMKSATDNAGELIEDLTRQFNRARQAVITREITEIAGGAEALAQQRGG